MTVRINKQKINLREKLAETEEKVSFDEVVRGLGEYDENVGIGTTSPSGKLHLFDGYGVFQRDVSAAGQTTNIALRNDDSSDDIEVGLDFQGLDANQVLRTAARIGCVIENHQQNSLETRLYFAGNGSTPDMTIDSSGNVGIGTTSPDSLLHLQKSVASGDAEVLMLRNPLANAVGESVSIAFQGAIQIDMAKIEARTQGANASGAPCDLVFQTASNGSAASDRMTIDSNGNVGIGTTNPVNILHIHGDSSDDNGDVALRIQNPNGGASTTSSIRFTNTTSTFDHAAIVATREGSGANLGSLQFYTNQNLNSGTPAMTIDSLGNVGIGTANPGYELEVIGDINASVNLRAAGTIITSDDRVKHNEQAIVGAIETLGKITPKKYIKTTEMYEANHDFELDEDGNPVDANGEPVEHSIEAGVIAQQVLEVPELAFMVSPEGVDEDGNVTSPHGLNYNSLFTYAIAAIQEQQQIIEDLKSRIETLESK